MKHKVSRRRLIVALSLVIVVIVGLRLVLPMYLPALDLKLEHGLRTRVLDRMHLEDFDYTFYVSENQGAFFVDAYIPDSYGRRKNFGTSIAWDEYSLAPATHILARDGRFTITHANALARVVEVSTQTLEHDKDGVKLTIRHIPFHGRSLQILLSLSSDPSINADMILELADRLLAAPGSSS